jgi:hypothetical protein
MLGEKMEIVVLLTFILDQVKLSMVSAFRIA